VLEKPDARQMFKGARHLRIGYPCVNRSIGCTAGSKFRIANYSEERLRSAVAGNLRCLSRMLEFNAANGLLFFRVGSGIVPFASHPICRLRWSDEFAMEFAEAGRFAKDKGMRITMHQAQFILLNSPDRGIVERSVAELEYHCRVLDLMGLDQSAKVQIHIGGAYGDRQAALARFAEECGRLSRRVRARLAIENDHRLFALRDCLAVSARCGVPVIFDVFHHACLNNGESVREALELACGTWKGGDGLPMVDYSEQQPGKKTGSHAEHIDLAKFRRFLEDATGLDFDVMLEIKDKEGSALQAVKLIKTS